VFVGSGGGDEAANAIYEAVAAFPGKVGDIVGDAKFPMENGGQEVVARTIRIVEEVEHTYLIIIAIVEADGTTVAKPVAIAWSHEEFHLIVLQTSLLQGSTYDRLVAGFLDAHPCLCSSLLNTIHEIKVQHSVCGLNIDSRLAGTFSERLDGAFFTCLIELRAPVLDKLLCIITLIALMTWNEESITWTDYNGLDFLPLAWKPHTIVEGSTKRISDATLGTGILYLNGWPFIFAVIYMLMKKT
jgi:hypothetical protein